MTATIPMLCFGTLCFVALERELPQDLDPNLNCEKVIEIIRPAIVPAAKFQFNCVLVPEPCSARGRNKCQKPGDYWVTE